MGGVEAVIHAQTRAFATAGYPVIVAAGRGDPAVFEGKGELLLIPEMDSQHPTVLAVSSSLEKGQIPPDFEQLVVGLTSRLAQVISKHDNLIAHNLFTKHFNLPLTAALHRLLDEGLLRNAIAWCHDFSWTSASSRLKLHPGYPWDLLKSYRPDLTYVTVSKERRSALARLLVQPMETVKVIYNGVDPGELLGLSQTGLDLIHRLRIFECDLVLLMPVRITRAKNIEFALQLMAALKDLGCKPKLIVTGPPDPHDEQSLLYYRELLSLREQLEVEAEAHFIFESGPDPQQPFTIDAVVVGDLYRVSDLMLMPSHYEGFGMPVLEAGLAGVPVLSTKTPAAIEIGGGDIDLFEPRTEPSIVAGNILNWQRHDRVQGLRRRVRRSYTWDSIFQRDILPLLTRNGED